MNKTFVQLGRDLMDKGIVFARHAVKPQTGQNLTAAGQSVPTVVRMGRNSGQAILWSRSARRVWRLNWACAMLVFVLAGLAASNLDRLQQQALDRFGPEVARFVGEWRAMLPTQAGLPELEKLEQVNTFFNLKIRWVEDRELWQQEDYWATLLETLSKGAGDCEDFAIAKYVSLLSSGVQENKLRLTYVRLQQQVNSPAVAHMVLAYYADPAAEPLILDNFVSEIMPASKRSDLAPVYSFNAAHLWFRGSSPSTADPTARISRWRDVLARLQAEYSL